MSEQRLYHNMPYSVVTFAELVPVAAFWVLLVGGALVRLFDGLAQNFNQTGGLFLVLLSGLLLLSARIVFGRMHCVALDISAAGFAHLVMGRIGWMDRYAAYALLMLAARLIMAGLGRDWTRLGALQMQNPAGFLGGAEVQLYTAVPAFTRSLNAARRLWEKGLPQDAAFVFSKVGV